MTRVTMGLAAMAAMAVMMATCSWAAAAGQIDGRQAGWTSVQSLRDLPAGVQVLLGVGLAPGDGIADKGEPYDESDVLLENAPPGRRFALGLLGGDTAIVAVEQRGGGPERGLGHAVTAVEFRQTGSTWAPVRCSFIGGNTPHRADELLALLAANPGQRPAACRLPGW